MSTGPIGYIFHWSSKKPIHPLGGEYNPPDETKLVVHSGVTKPECNQFRFVAVDGAGHFGYIEHVSSKKIVHPKGGSSNPPDQTRLVLSSGRHAGALFGFDEENNGILHRCGRYWHPSGGSTNPGDNTEVLVHSGLHDGARFYLVILTKR